MPKAGRGIVDQREIWGQDKAQKGRMLLTEIIALADRARAAGFTTTEYILKMAATELSKDLDATTG
jgi:hypothetical protein